MFSLVDYLLFAAFLLLSLVVGVYHAVVAAFRKKKNPGTDTGKEFLVGGRALPVLPVCLSLLTTFISGIALLGVPAEIYNRGFFMTIIFSTGVAPFILSYFFFVPVFYKLQFISVYEYLEMRFASRFLRRAGAILFMASTLFYTAIVMYAPAIALVGVTKGQLAPFILAVGGVSTAYTALGGIKAVVWTDTLQAFFLYFGLGVLLVKGTTDVGGLTRMFEIVYESGRFSSLTHFDLTVFQHNSAFIMFFGGIAHWCSMYGLNQMALQRYCSMPSLADAKKVILFTIPAFVLIAVMVSYLGMLLLSHFHGCDPLSLGEITSKDQMTILMANRVLGVLPGLSGLFLSCLFSSTLSTVSSSLNSMTAVVFEDFLKFTSLAQSDNKATRVMKALTVLFGIISTILAFLCDYMDGMFNAATTVLGAICGPLVGLFFLGVFVPRANRNGAKAGLVVAASLLVFLAVTQQLERPYGKYMMPLKDAPQENHLCMEYVAEAESGALFPHSNSTSLPRFATLSWYEVRAFHYGDPNTSYFARYSAFLYPITGVFLIFAIGIPVSLLFPVKMSASRANAAYACTIQGVNVHVDWSQFLKDRKKSQAKNLKSLGQRNGGSHTPLLVAKQ